MKRKFFTCIILLVLIAPIILSSFPRSRGMEDAFEENGLLVQEGQNFWSDPIRTWVSENYNIWTSHACPYPNPANITAMAYSFDSYGTSLRTSDLEVDHPSLLAFHQQTIACATLTFVLIASAILASDNSTEKSTDSSAYPMESLVRELQDLMTEYSLNTVCYLATGV